MLLSCFLAEYRIVQNPDTRTWMDTLVVFGCVRHANFCWGKCPTWERVSSLAGRTRMVLRALWGPGPSRAVGYWSFAADGRPDGEIGKTHFVVGPRNLFLFLSPHRAAHQLGWTTDIV